MRELRLFLKSVGRQGAEAVTGIIVTVAALVWQIATWIKPDLSSPPARPWMLWVIGIGFCFYSAFLAWRDEVRKRETSEASLQGMQVANKGIKLNCSNLVLGWEPHPELPQGVMAILDFTSLVNGNTQDAIIRTRLVAPLWRNGNFVVTSYTEPLSSTFAFITAKTEQFRRVINLPAKRAVGPGHFLFFFDYEKESVVFFLPDSVHPKTLEQYVDLLKKSEMYIELEDLADGVPIPHIPAPGTMQKAADRALAEKRAESA